MRFDVNLITMTKRLLIFFISIFLAIFSFTIFSCQKKNVMPQTQDETETEDDTIEISEPKPIEIFTDSVVLYDNASLWLFGRDEKMHSFYKIPANTIVSVVSVDDEHDTKIAPTEKSETENIYLHVIYNSVDFWILESLVAPASTPAVIVERARLYKENEPTDTYLKFGTAIALGAETEVFENRKFEKIYYFDAKVDSVVSGFIEAGKASAKNDDIVVADIVEKLKVTTRAVPRNELFLKAEKYNPSKSVKAELENQKVEKISYDYNEVIQSMNKTSRYRVNLDELNTVDQSKDPFQ